MDYIIWKITETEQELLSQLEHPEYFAEKVANLKDGSRRKLEVLAVRRALKELFYGEEQRVAYTADGKPYLLPLHPSSPHPSSSHPSSPNHISISHTDGYAAVITSAEAPVGIDIERIGTRVEKVVSHFLKPEEIVVLKMAEERVNNSPFSTLHSPFSTLHYHLAWSAKEAAYKILGREYFDLQHLTSVIALDWEAKTLLLKAEGIEKPLVIHFDVADDYVLTWLML